MKNIEICGQCEEEVEYEIKDYRVAVACPNQDCFDGIFIHCDACRNGEVPNAPKVCSVETCPWHDEACPHSGAIVPIHDDRPDDHKGMCPCGCGMEFTKFEHVNSWED